MPALPWCLARHCPLAEFAGNLITTGKAKVKVAISGEVSTDPWLLSSTPNAHAADSD